MAGKLMAPHPGVGIGIAPRLARRLPDRAQRHPAKRAKAVEGAVGLARSCGGPVGTESHQPRGGERETRDLSSSRTQRRASASRMSTKRPAPALGRELRTDASETSRRPAQGVRSLSVSCWLCHHGAVLTADRWSDEVPLPSFGPRMVGSSCGIAGRRRTAWAEQSSGRA
jgi:hypothetical protein